MFLLLLCFVAARVESQRIQSESVDLSGREAWKKRLQMVLPQHAMRNEVEGTFMVEHNYIYTCFPIDTLEHTRAYDFVDVRVGRGSFVRIANTLRQSHNRSRAIESDRERASDLVNHQLHSAPLRAQFLRGNNENRSPGTVRNITTQHRLSAVPPPPYGMVFYWWTMCNAISSR